MFKDASKEKVALDIGLEGKGGLGKGTLGSNGNMHAVTILTEGQSDIFHWSTGRAVEYRS